MSCIVNKVNKLIIGASVWSCGYAAVQSDDILIIEPTAVLGSEFAGAYRCDAVPVDDKLSVYGEDMRNDFIRRNLIDDKGNICITPVTSYLASVLHKKKTPVMLMSRVLSIRESDSGYTVEFYNNIDGFGRVECESIIDTTSILSARLSLRAMLGGGIKNHTDIDGYNKDGVYVLRGRFEREYVLALEADSLDLCAMRKKFKEKWKQLCHGDFEGWEIASLASFLTYTYDKPVRIDVGNNYFKIPSASYKNIIDAYEGGVAYALRENN